jgi:hypothetical protein
MKFGRFFLNGVFVRVFGQVIVEILGPKMTTISGQFANIEIYWPYIAALELIMLFFCLCIALLGLALAYILINSEFELPCHSRTVLTENIDLIFSSLLGIISGLILSNYLTWLP